MPPLPTNVEGCGSRRSANTTDNISLGPQGPYPDTPGISAGGRGRHDATDEQPQYFEGIGGEGQSDQTKFIMMEFRNFQQPERPDTLAPQNKK